MKKISFAFTWGVGMAGYWMDRELGWKSGQVLESLGIPQADPEDMLDFFWTYYFEIPRRLSLMCTSTAGFGQADVSTVCCCETCP